MFVRAKKVRFLEDVLVELTFQDGKIIQYDMSRMFSKYPQLEELRSKRSLFENGQLDVGGYGIIWNDELDFDAMSIYESGKVVGREPISANEKIGMLLLLTREEAGITQTELAKQSGINQADISRIERGVGNPTLAKIERLFAALNKQVSFSCEASLDI